jgi:transcriptional regulator CtsR
MAAAVSARALSVPLTDELKNAMRARIMKSMLMTIAARNKG